MRVRVTLRATILIATGLIVLRSFVFLAYEQSYFDSDQAVTGLMAKHLAEGRAFPLFFYGQHYMLAVEAWLAAPLFALASASVFALRVPLVAINVCAAALLLRGLVRDAGLGPGAALVASAFFVIPPPVAASRLVEAQGGNVEPFLYVLLIWVCRARPIWLGVVMGIGVLNREFTAYGILALLALEAASGALWGRRALARWSVAAFVAMGIWGSVWAIKPYADLLGPGTASVELARGGSHVGFAASRAAWKPADVAGNIDWLVRRNLPALFGGASGPLAVYVNSALDLDTGWLAWPLGIGFLLVLGRVARLQWRGGHPPPGTNAFGAYLLIVGMVAALVYAVFNAAVRHEVLVRYTLLTLLAPIGAVALLWRAEPRRRVRAAVAVCIAVWAAFAVRDHGRLIAEYATHPPRSPHAVLARYLDGRGWRFGWGDYWTAYHVTFLARERVIVASREKVRIREYQDLVEAQRGKSVVMWPPEDGWCPQPLHIAKWYVCTP